MDVHNFQPGIDVILKLESNGFEAAIVGGAVRDYLLGRNIHDIDITTSATGREIKDIFVNTVDVAIKHGTVIVRHKGRSFEVTSYRGVSLLEDLRRRDFTINAMAFTSEKRLVDPFYGTKDIEKKTIRGVNNPTKRFQEDPLRILRALRFVSELGFDIETETFTALKTEARFVRNVAMERISLEMQKIWLGPYVKKSLCLFSKIGLLEEIEPLLPFQRLLENANTGVLLSKLTNITEIWAFLFYQTKELDMKGLLKEWKQSNKTSNEVEAIVKRLPNIIEKGLLSEDLYHLGLETSIKAGRLRAVILNEVFDQKEVEACFAKLPIKRKKDLAINGYDISFILKKEEPVEKIGQLLSIIERAVVTEKVQNNKDAIFDWLGKEGYINAK